MRRERVAVLGAGGLFQGSLTEALADYRWFQVMVFSLDDGNATTDEVNIFGPTVVLVVRGANEPLPTAALAQMERGVPIVTVDPKEPVMMVTFKACGTSATLNKVLEALRTAGALRVKNVL